MKLHTHHILSELESKDPNMVLRIVVTSRGLTDISCLQHFLNLQILNIANNRISDLSFLSKLSLVTFIADYNPIVSISQISSQDKLENLSLSSCKLSLESLKPISSLKNLRRLTLFQTPASENAHFYSEIISMNNTMQFLNEERVREPNGDLTQLDKFIDSIPNQHRKFEYKTESWLPEAAFEVFDLPGFSAICQELEGALGK
ncbi:Leucine-rich_repeat protein [Hexamita inflata]|uniref:Leucine-rich repeat protein n=1 Tax=Hexamita inflata TaxID=28002 RepID=A0AA86P324_9EUKA|nr:Leucine-rich repeat protein [Hexamita inflata]